MADFRGLTMTNLRKAATAMALAAAMGSQALAAEGSLTAGKPAGVQEAQRRTNLLLIGGGIAIAVVAVAVAISGSSSAACDAAHCPVVTPATST